MGVNCLKPLRIKLSKPLFVIAVVLSILSQIESISMSLKPLVYVIWPLILGYQLVLERHRIRLSSSTRLFCINYTGYLLLSIVLEIFQGGRLDGHYLGIMPIPLIVSIIAELYKGKLTWLDIQHILKIYVACALIYALWVNITYFPSYTNWLLIKVYQFEEKNSAAQIWSVAIAMLLFLIEYRTVYGKILSIVLTAYLFLVIGLSQCRTAILAWGVIIILYTLKKPRWGLLGGVLLIIAAAILWNIPFVHTYIEQALLLNKYQGTDLNTFSSGRITYWGQAIETFLKHPLVGTGKYYVDCSYIMILAESGLVGLALIESVWIVRVITNLRYNRNKVGHGFLYVVTVFYIIESILEGHPPFGPGVCAFMYWFLSVLFTTATDNRLGIEEGIIGQSPI